MKQQHSALEQESFYQTLNNKSVADPLSLTSSENLPEIAKALRETGTVCVERTFRILSKSRATRNSDQIAERIRAMGKTYARGSKSTDGQPSGFNSGSLQKNREEQITMLKEIQRENAAALLQGRVKILKSVLAKNKQLVDSVPQNIAPDDIKRDFLKMRKNLMVRLIHSELRNKKISEWNFKSLHRI